MNAIMTARNAVEAVIITVALGKLEQTILFGLMDTKIAIIAGSYASILFLSIDEAKLAPLAIKASKLLLHAPAKIHISSKE